MKTIGQWLSAQSFSSYSDREYILQYILTKTRSELYLSWDQTLTEDQIQRYSSILAQYEQGHPLSYILGETEFYSQPFKINKNVFIPRMETEILVESILDHYRQTPPFHFMDWGCGSGCIGLSLLKKWSHSHLTAIDINQQSITCTKENAKALKTNKRLTLLNENILSLYPQDFPPVSLIIANPPYIAWNDPNIDSSVVEHEPHSALFSGPTGLESIQFWLNQAVHFLSYQKNGGDYFFEMGYNQYLQVKKLLEQHSLIDSFNMYLDYQSHPRGIHCSIQTKKN